VKIPAYWAKATATDTDREGKPASFSCWRSSDHSIEDAHESALAAAKQVLRRLLSGNRVGRYGYGETPLREEIVESIANAQGEMSAAVTRNGYGSLVLSTDRVMFIDLDFPLVSVGESLRYFFARLFRPAAVSPAARCESDARRRLEEFLAGNPHWGFRLYRTCAGLRALATHDLFDPADEAAQATMQTLGADPLYVRLCKAQGCFRARLTPKPWRCGQQGNPPRWPFESDQQARLFQQWESAYARKQARYATCRFLGELGAERVHPEVQGIIELHDRMTRCHERLELA
jgi:hypothetical protein